LFAIILLWGSIAQAHICVLTEKLHSEHFDPSVSSKSQPCALADAADGTTDDTINAEVSAQTDIELYVIFGQPTEAQLNLMGWTEKWSFDPTMVNPVGCDCRGDSGTIAEQQANPGSGTCPESGTACTHYPMIDTDPDSWLGPGSDFIANYVNKVDDSTYNIFTSPASIFSTTGNDNLNLTALVMENEYDEGGTVTDIVFSSDDTLVLDGDGCDLLSEACGGASIQKKLTTTFSVTQDPCYTGKASVSGSLSCKGSGDTCDDSTGPFTATFSYGLPTGCWYADGTTPYTPCEGKKVEITSSLGGTTTMTTAGTYSETITDSSSQLSYTIVGNSDSCQPSDATTGSNFGTVSAGPATCQCGVVPVIDLVEALDGPYIQSGKITVKFKVTLDPDLSLPGDVQEIKFYYLNDPAASAQEITIPVSELNSNGEFEAEIDGDFVISNTDIYYGVIVRDANNIEGSYPQTFDKDDVVGTAGTISGDDIIIDVVFKFIDGHEPYPNQFPFRAGGEQILKIWFQLNDTAEVTSRIYSLDGMLIRHLDDSTESLDSCSNDEPDSCNLCNYEEGCVWDGTTYEGGTHFVSNGLYIVNIHAFCTGDLFPGSTVDHTKGIVVMK